MRKPNIKNHYTEKNVEEKRLMRSMSPAIGLTPRPLRLTMDYENVNKVNHVPFADKLVPDILPDRERFKTFYQQEQAPAALRQSASQLEGNLRDNNDLNKSYKKNLL